jgi:hypothetical protein
MRSIACPRLPENLREPATPQRLSGRAPRTLVRGGYCRGVSVLLDGVGLALTGSSMQRKSFPGIEVSGLGVIAIVEAFKLFPSIVLKRLVDEGIGTYRGGQIVVDSDRWYPLDNWLAAFGRIAESVGPRGLFKIGQHVQDVAVLPPSLTDIHTCVAGTNLAYHLNHRKNGTPMFDPATGEKLSGIGDYGYAPVPGERRIISKCDTPYPCEFDRGVLFGFALRFEKGVQIEHQEPGPCRRKSDDSCVYVITW